MNDTTSAPAEQAGIPEQRLERLRALATTLTSLGLVGRWGWFGQDTSPYLSTRTHGRQIVLGLTGQVVVRTPAPAGGPCIMRKPREIPVYEVAPDAMSARDTRVYRRDVIGMRTPVAEWLAECDPDTVLALLDEVTRLRVALAGDDETARCRPDVNDAAERFDASDLLEALVEEAEGDCLVLDGAEWWLSDTETEPGSFTITDGDTGERYRVELDAVIRKVERTPTTAGRAVVDVVSSL